MKLIFLATLVLELTLAVNVLALDKSPAHGGPVQGVDGVAASLIRYLQDSGLRGQHMILFGVSLLLVVVFGAFLFLAKNRQLRRIENLQRQQIAELDRTSRTLVRRDFELSQTLEALRLMDESKSHFVAVAAHQLRTPLSAIKWTLKLLLDEDLGAISPNQREYISSAYQTNERMIRLINDLLDVARIEGGRFEFVFLAQDLASLIEEVVLSFKISAQNRNINLTFTKPPRPLSPVVIDTENIRTVLENLLENAIEYTPSGGRVAAELREEGGFLRVAITDSGIGIGPEDQSQLFNKFYRSGSAVKMFPNGTGLGLYICREIILRHGGSIEVKSEVGQGSTFSFTLPRKNLQ
ncbi:MAG: HAMP domain-containing histidine kinase [Parcubacteria group bacterium]|nr:HAMP domain-containing histidine kinase [Parcubacteria group bacterium]